MNTLFPVVNLLKCVVTEVIVFNLLLKLDISQGSVVTHLGCGGFFILGDHPLELTKNAKTKHVSTAHTGDRFVKEPLIPGHKCHKTVRMDRLLLYIWHTTEHTLLTSAATITKDQQLRH